MRAPRGDGDPDRRAFLARSVRAVAACGLLGSGACAGLRYAPATLVAGRLIVRSEDLGEDGTALVEHPTAGRPVYLFPADGGGYGAVLTRCTHRGCQVEPWRDRLVCPCHGSAFTRDGAVIEGPAERPLAVFATEVEGDRIMVDLERSRGG